MCVVRLSSWSRLPGLWERDPSQRAFVHAVHFWRITQGYVCAQKAISSGLWGGGGRFMHPCRLLPRNTQARAYPAGSSWQHPPPAFLRFPI